MLGLPEPGDASKIPGCSDLPSRLDSQISRVLDLGCRLAEVQKRLHALKEAVG